MKKITILSVFLFLFLIMVLPGHASAATYYWTGGTGASINVAGNWSTTTNDVCGSGTGGAVPSTGDTAVFDSVCTHSANIDTNWSVAGLTIGTGYTGTITQTSTNSLTVGSSGFSQAAGTFISNPSTNAFTSTSNFVLSGGK